MFKLNLILNDSPKEKNRLTIFFLVVLILSAILFSKVSHAWETMPISFSENSKTIHAFGRIMPDFGSLKVEKALSIDEVKDILVVEGQVVRPGTPIVQLKAPCKLRIKNCIILSTSSGVTGEILRFKGSLMKPEDGLISVFNPKEISVRLDVPVAHLKSIKIGQKIALTDSSQSPDVHYKSEVIEILPSVGLADTTRGVRLKFITPVKSILLTTMLDAEIQIPLNQQKTSKTKGAKIPTKALSFYRSKHYLVKKQNEKLIPVEVQILSETDKYAWIQAINSSELMEEDQILSSNSIFYIKSLMESKK